MDNNFTNDSQEELIEPLVNDNSYGNGLTPNDQSIDYDSRDTAVTNSKR